MNEYTKMVDNLFANPDDILHRLTYSEVDVLHAAVGIAGESGEVLDLVKKHVFYGQPLDEEKLILELGDIEFYLEAIRLRVGISREEVLKANIDKLSKRYHEGKFSASQAIGKADEKS